MGGVTNIIIEVYAKLLVDALKAMEPLLGVLQMKANLCCIS